MSIYLVPAAVLAIAALAAYRLLRIDRPFEAHRAPLARRPAIEDRALPPGTYDHSLTDALNAGATRAQPMSLLLIDIDGADVFGGGADGGLGNAMRWLLRRTNAVARDGQDTVARYGPTGYALVLADADAKFANAVADRLRLVIETAGAKTDEGLARALTISIGASTWYPAQPHDAIGLTAAADFALFASRKAGGNRVSAVPYPIDIDHTMKMSSAVQLASGVPRRDDVGVTS